MGVENRVGSSGDLSMEYQQAKKQSIIPRSVIKGLGRVGEYFLYALLVVIFVTPFAWMFLGSVRNEAEIFAYLYPFGWHTFVPVEWTLKNFLDIFGLSEEGKGLGFSFQFAITIYRWLVGSVSYLTGMTGKQMIKVVPSSTTLSTSIRP